MSKLRILLVVEEEIIRTGLTALLESRPGWEICGGVSVNEAVEEAKRLEPDIVVLDVIPELHVLEVTRGILKALPKTEILAFITRGIESKVDDLMTAGARGFVLQSDAAKDLMRTVEALSQHRPFLTNSVTEVMLQSYLEIRKGQRDGTGLTRRQREIVSRLAQGQTNKEVASALEISPKTVEAHRAKVMHKLKLSSFSDLIHFAIRNRIVEV